MTAVICWVVLMIIMVVIEVVRFDLTWIWFGVGALLASVAALFGLPIWAQCLAFAVISLVLTFFVKPLMRRRIEEKKETLQKKAQEDEENK